MIKKIVFFVLLATLAGCVSTDSIFLTDTRYPPVRPDQVEIFLSAEDAPETYTTIASIEAKGDYNISRSKFLEGLREEAAKVGANGVIVGETQAPSTGSKIAAALLIGSANNRVEAIAIRY